MIRPLSVEPLQVMAAANELAVVYSTKAQRTPGDSSAPIRMNLISHRHSLLDEMCVKSKQRTQNRVSFGLTFDVADESPPPTIVRVLCSVHIRLKSLAVTQTGRPTDVIVLKSDKSREESV